MINPIESMIDDAYRTASLIARNDVVASLDDLARMAGPGGGAIAESIPAHQLRPLKVDLFEALRKAGKEQGLDDMELDDLLLAASERLDTEEFMLSCIVLGTLRRRASLSFTSIAVESAKPYDLQMGALVVSFMKP